MFVTPAYAQAAAPAPGGDLFGMLLLIVPMFVVMYFFILRPQQQRLKKHAAMISAIRKGDTVVTGGGFVGKVSRIIDDHEVEIDLGGTKVTALRSTISDVRVRGEPVANQNAKK
jgi:preprotein translocase subunit YajC